MGMIDAGDSVVVCSPTGSGKTLIAEYAAYKAVHAKSKIFYTTPLKALSNQKFYDFRKIYGEERVGLLTGDISINRDAQIVVMTTEVFRNMLYGVYEESKLLADIGYVILDECHYMNDAERGTVWEESIIYCPESIQIIALSATIANALVLTDWINEVHHNTRLVASDFRPVPLRHFYFTREKIYPLFKGDSDRLNPKIKFDHRGRKVPRQRRGIKPLKLIEQLHQRNMLPAIIFTFSRKGCDRYLWETLSADFLSRAERRLLKKEIDDYVRLNPFLEGNRYLKAISNGFASHHAGLLPALKGLVEILFQQGLIKAVFATETLAAGINMPARSTVITAISKRTDEGHRILTASEFLQMSGRAGRRGMDEVGYVVTCSTPYESAQDVGLLASSPADPLNSQFTPTYGMVLNLLQRYSLTEAEFLVAKSFGSFTAEQRIVPLKEELEKVTRLINEGENFECPENWDLKKFQSYLRSKDMLHETQKHVKIYRSQIKRHGKSPELLKAMAKEEGKLNSLKETIDDAVCRQCDLYKKHKKSVERLERLKKKRKKLNRQCEEESDQYWREFMGHYTLLKEAGFIDVDSDYPTEPGQLTAKVRAENEFFIAQVILSGVLDHLEPGPLAAIVCALMAYSGRETQQTHLRLSPQAHHAMVEVKSLAKQVDRLQRKHRIDTPVNLNPQYSPLLEAWVQGYSWERLMDSCTMDEGDVFRVIRRTSDMLRQLSRIDQVPLSVSRSASSALDAIHRDPIREDTEELQIEEQFKEEEGIEIIDLPPLE